MKNRKSNRISPTSGRKRIYFHLKTDPENEVFMAGSFNDWNQKAKKMVDRDKNGEYGITLFLLPGRHEYKFIINGEWHVDPECPDWVVNDCGTLNSIITVDG